ncbi:MAG: FecR domain-containing protein, partial [Opitutae bacterium]|nr:FecR domain-containing protein [Opitutae bacterium]
MNRTNQTASADRPPMTSVIEAAAADWVTRVDAGLTREEQQIFQDWLSGDPRHADAFDRLTEAWSVFDRVQERGVASTILDQLAARARRRRIRRVQAGIAASLVLTAGLVYFHWQVAAPGAVRSAPAVIAQAALPDPVRKLPDGSIVELNTGAEIEVRYSAETRHVKLVRGEAFFRVEKDKGRPFIVEAHGVVVRAVGTAFAVQMQPTAVEVVVQEGAVDVGR